MRKIIFLLIVSLLLVSPILAQGGALAYGTNTLSTLSAASPLAFFTFNGTAGDLVTVSVIGITPGLDPAVSLNSPAQQQLASNDNANSGTTDAQIALSLPQTGVFTVLVSSVTGAPGDFLLRLNGQAPPPTTPLTDVPLNTSVTPDIPQLFSFNANPTEIITLNISTATPDFGFRTTVRDADGNIVAMVRGSDIVGVSLPFPPGAATYTAEIAALDPNLPGQVSIFLGGPPAAAESFGASSVPSPAETEEAAPVGLPGGVCGVSPGRGVVNVRTGPATDFGRIAQLQPSQVLEVTGRYADWYQVNVPNIGTGWVSSTVVFTTGLCGNIPEVNPLRVVETEEVSPTIHATPTYTPTYTPTTHQDQLTATATPTATQDQLSPTMTYTVTPTYTLTYTPTYTPTATSTPSS